MREYALVDEQDISSNGERMKRMLALVTAAIALAACADPTAPSDAGPQVAKARSALTGAAKMLPNGGTSGKLASN